MKTIIQILAFSYRNWIFAKRNVFTFIELVFWPSIGVLTIGLMGDFLTLQADTLSFLMMGAIAQGVLQVCQLDVVYGIMLYDFWSKSVKHSFLAPVSPWQQALGTWLTGMVRGLVVFALLALFGYWGFGFRLPGFALTMHFLFGSFACALLIGCSACVLILWFGQRAEISAWALSLLMVILAGMYYPPSLLPEPFRTLAAWMPLSYFLEAARSGYGFKPVLRGGVAMGWLIVVVECAVVYLLLLLAVRRARKSGLLLRLSE